MKEWKEPELWELGVEKTQSSLGTSGNDKWLPDRFENCIEGFLGRDIIGERS